MIPLMLAVSLAIFALAGVVIVAMGGATRGRSGSASKI